MVEDIGKEATFNLKSMFVLCHTLYGQNKYNKYEWLLHVFQTTANLTDNDLEPISTRLGSRLSKYVNTSMNVTINSTANACAGTILLTASFMFVILNDPWYFAGVV